MKINRTGNLSETQKSAFFRSASFIHFVEKAKEINNDITVIITDSVGGKYKEIYVENSSRTMFAWFEAGSRGAIKLVGWK